MENISKDKYTKEDINYLLGNELKNHYLKRENNFNINTPELKTYPIYKNENREESEEIEFNSNTSKLKYKFMLKFVMTLFVAVCILGYRYVNNDQIKDNIVISWIRNEYKNNYSIEQVLEGIEELSKTLYSKIEPVVPEDIYNKVVNKYVMSIKPEIVNFNINNLFENKAIDNTIAVFNEDNVQIENTDIVKAEEVIVTSSEVSLMDMDRQEIASKNINICLPVEGTVTSDYGARDEVFENVGYHTGIDVANVLNTPVKSATDGKVTFVKEMDKYYGNNIEIEKDGVTFKYAHLNKINVNVGDEINQGDIIGLMGSTGMSTGSHLHFEIKINGRTVNPELILKFR